MGWSGDAYKDADTHDWRNRHRSADYPSCDICKKTITDKHLYRIDGELVCTECLNEHYREETEYFLL